uniref:MYND-type domain-containing protein n=1 Tax=Neobodo designis TaxID=312471 RepID=A0A7S1QJ31_NEODS
MEALERQVEQMRTMVLNTVDENRFLRLEVDVLRDALLERDDAEAQARAENSLRLIGRRAGTRELRDQSICTNCLKRTKCFRCYACCSVEYCSSRCQMENFAAHVELCRHITERCM